MHWTAGFRLGCMLHATGPPPVMSIVRLRNMTEDQFYEIYNRACTENGGPEPLEGDRALANMLLGHGYIMNGGLEHFEDLSEEERRQSIAGYRFFGFNEAADLLVNSPRISEEDILAADEQFTKFDSEMMTKLRSYVDANSHQFRVSR